jgi:2-iminobutanoate/2-iminopropanoate deaminase
MRRNAGASGRLRGSSMIRRYLSGSGKVGTTLPIALAVRAGDYVFVSGQAALGPHGAIIDGGIVAQTEETIRRIVAVLDEAGCTLADVVKVTVWIDDPRDFGPMNEVFRKYFGDAPPARSTLVSPLVLDGKVEIEVMAYRPLKNEVAAGDA